MESSKTWVGIDVSKESLEVYLQPQGQRYQLPYTPQATRKLVRQLNRQTLGLVVLEANGGL